MKLKQLALGRPITCRRCGTGPVRRRGGNLVKVAENEYEHQGKQICHLVWTYGRGRMQK